jgi:predicted P-loop ATPase
VFAGTVNHGTYLRDETGARRFWPVACGRIDVEGLARDRDQLWAEAKARFDGGNVWWLETTGLVQLASDQQGERYESDPWEGVIAPWVEPRTSVSIRELLGECLNKPRALWTQGDMNRAARCLRALGWRYRDRHGAGWNGSTAEYSEGVIPRAVPPGFLVLFPVGACGKQALAAFVPSVLRLNRARVYGVSA